jgi:hypothetical protein
MKQKYLITKDQKTQQVTIQEFAELDKDVFSLVCEEAYDGDKIKTAVSEGKDELIETLRTPNLYPVAEYADRIADSVIELFNQGGQESIEIAFDDIDALKKEKAARAEAEEDESVALDDLLNEDLDEEAEDSESSDDSQNESADENSGDVSEIDEDSLDLFDSEEGDEDENEDSTE